MPSYESSTTRLDPHDRSRCALIQDLLPLYLEGEVSPTSQALIADHLSDCPHCAGFLAGARHVWAQVHREEAQRARTVARDAEAQQTVAAWRQWLTLVPTVLVALVLAGFVAVTVLGILEFLNGPASENWIRFGDFLNPLSFLLGGACLSFAFWRARQSGEQRVTKMTVSCVVIGMGAFFLWGGEQGALYALFGIILIMLGSIGIGSAFKPAT